MLGKKRNAQETLVFQHRVSIGANRTGFGLSSVCWALLFVCWANLTANAQSSRTTFGRIVMPNTGANSNRSSAVAPSHSTFNNSVHTRGLGPQSTPSAASHLNHGRLPPTMRLSQVPLRRSAERIARERVQVASYQDGISNNSIPDASATLPPASLPGETSLLDTSGVDLAPTDSNANAPRNSLPEPLHSTPQNPMAYGEQLPTIVYTGGDTGDIVYCDSHGMNCDCNNCVEDIYRFKLGVGVIGFNNAFNYAGTDTGPWSGDGSGSFGLQEILQWGTPMTGLFQGELGGQFGARLVQANFAGSEFTTDTRNQAYLTAGMFRRVDFGLQGGLVVDYLAERWYLNCDMVQLRGELSYMVDPCHEFGFRFTSGMQTSRSDGLIIDDNEALVTTSGAFGALNQHRFFYRQALSACGSESVEFSVGWTEEKHGILSGMLEKRLTDCLSCQSSFTFATPGDAVTNVDHQHEQWQIGMAFVWSFGVGNRRTGNDYYRPLFEVADPGSFFVAKKS